VTKLEKIERAEFISLIGDMGKIKISEFQTLYLHEGQIQPQISSVTLRLFLNYSVCCYWLDVFVIHDHGQSGIKYFLL
jgi:hypothetical protein